MNEFKGTKGKWEVIEHSWSDTSLVSGSKTIAGVTIYNDATEENQEELESEVAANFRLISKAPEMLAMLQSIVDSINPDTYPLGKIASAKIKQAEELIKQATTI